MLGRSHDVRTFEGITKGVSTDWTSGAEAGACGKAPLPGTEPEHAASEAARTRAIEAERERKSVGLLGRR
jgi:hypothetical protein